MARPTPTSTTRPTTRTSGSCPSEFGLSLVPEPQVRLISLAALRRSIRNNQQEAGTPLRARRRPVCIGSPLADVRLQTNASKTDGVIAEHKDLSLDDLVAKKIINADQKLQHLKKPALQSQVTQLETSWPKSRRWTRSTASAPPPTRPTWRRRSPTSTRREKADALADAKNKADADAKATQHETFLILSQFLRLAAAPPLRREQTPSWTRISPSRASCSTSTRATRTASTPCSSWSRARTSRRRASRAKSCRTTCTCRIFPPSFPFVSLRSPSFPFVPLRFPSFPFVLLRSPRESQAGLLTGDTSRCSVKTASMAHSGPLYPADASADVAECCGHYRGLG